MDQVTTPLHQACLKGMAGVVRVLIQRGTLVDIQNEAGYTALQMAAYKGFVPIVQILIDGGADVNKHDRERDGFTALQMAVQEGHADVASLLLASDADPNIQNDMGDTALHLAVRKGDFASVEALLKAGADPTIKDEEGRLPVNDAPSEAIAQLLEKYGGSQPATPMDDGRRRGSRVPIMHENASYNELLLKCQRLEHTALLAQKDVIMYRDRAVNAEQRLSELAGEMKAKDTLISQLQAQVAKLEGTAGTDL